MKTLLVTAFSVSLGCHAFSQSLPSDTSSGVTMALRPVPKHHFTLHLHPLLALEARLGYERMVGSRQAIGLQLAYKPNWGETSIAKEIPGDHSDESYLASTSYSLFVNYKYFLVKNPRSFFRPFVEAEVMGRYMEYKDKQSLNGLKEKGSHQTVNRDKTVYGNVLMIGSRFYFNRARSLFVDVYGGFSGRITYLNSKENEPNKEDFMTEGRRSQQVIHNIFLEGKPQVGATFGVAF